MPSIQISVITSLFRCAPFLESFLQFYNNITNLQECELILVHNDPSPEELAILERCTRREMNIVHLCVEREGLYASWNRAIRFAKGKYIAVWNVDDVRTPTSLADQRTALDNSAAVMCYGDFYGTKQYGMQADKLYQYEPYERCRKDALTRHIIGCFPMWRKDIHQQVGYFDEQFRLVSDYEFQLRIASAYPLVKAGGVLGYYLEHANHKLSSNRKLQTCERTVVEIRYRLYHHVLLHMLPFISQYQINSIRQPNGWIHIAAVAPQLRRRSFRELASLLSTPLSYSYWFIKKGIQTIHQRLLRFSAIDK